MRHLFWSMISVTLFFDAADAQEARTSLSFYGGKMTDNGYTTVLFEPQNLEFRDHKIAGVSATREWPLWGIGYVGVEGQIARHWGEQEYWEFIAPAYLRSHRPEQPYFPSLSYGLGLSYTTALPDVEIERRGQTQRLLAYWFIEFEFGGVDAQINPYIRLHHRSDAYGLFENDTSSNAIVIGFRRDIDGKQSR